MQCIIDIIVKITLIQVLETDNFEILFKYHFLIFQNGPIIDVYVNPYQSNEVEFCYFQTKNLYHKFLVAQNCIKKGSINVFFCEI